MIDKIKYEMIKQGMNQKELSEKSGISKETISNLLNGKDKSPNVKTLNKLLNAIDMGV